MDAGGDEHRRRSGEKTHEEGAETRISAPDVVILDPELFRHNDKGHQKKQQPDNSNKGVPNQRCLREEQLLIRQILPDQLYQQGRTEAGKKDQSDAGIFRQTDKWPDIVCPDGTQTGLGTSWSLFHQMLPNLGAI